MALRQVRPDELAQLTRLVEDYHAFEEIPPNPATPEILRPLLTGDTLGRVWFVEEDGAVIGYVALCFGYSIEFGGRDAFVDEVFIEAAHRGRGLGKAALEALREEARRMGIVALHLEVGKENPRARRLYEGVGFRVRARYDLMTLPLQDRAAGH